MIKLWKNLLKCGNIVKSIRVLLNICKDLSECLLPVLLSSFMKGITNPNCSNVNDVPAPFDTTRSYKRACSRFSQNKLIIISSPNAANIVSPAVLS